MALLSDTPDFLFENANRSFPFEDSNELQDTMSFSSVLDLKGFSRSKITGKIMLIGASRWDTSRDKPISDSTYISDSMEQGKVQLYFMVPSYPNDIYLQTGVTIGETEWPRLATASIQNNAGVDYVKISIILGKTILSDFATTSYTKFENTYLEQSLVMECYKKSLDQFKILHSSGSEEYITGDVVFANGTNAAISQSGNSIMFYARVGAGEGRGINTETEISEKCDGIVSIDGIHPDEDGKFVIEGGLGVSVVDDPDNHKIIISIQSDSRLLECSEAP